LTYIYVWTADDKKFERIKKTLEFAKSLDETPVFCVNDLEAIEKITKNGFKAMNVDAVEDLLNVGDGSDTYILCTPEEIESLKAIYKNVKEIL